MTPSHAFRPSVMLLETRALPSAIYATGLQNNEQDAYVAQAAQAENPVVFLGDSITYNWGTATRPAPGTSVFSEDFAPLGAANFGIYGDTTANLTARIEQGDLAGKPKVAVLMIGVNDIGEGHTALQAATGVLGVVDAIKAASPSTTILLLGVLPTDVAAFNPRIEQLDSLLSAVGNLPGVVYENPGAQFLEANGLANPSLLMDVVHPDQAGYTVLANAIDGTILDLLGQADYTADRPVPAETSATVPVASPAKTEPAASTAATDAVGPDVPVFLTPTPTDSTDAVATPSTAKAKSYATELINVTTT
jgi:lysophospholipase L1-like esterase